MNSRWSTTFIHFCSGTTPNPPAGETAVVSTDGTIRGFRKVDIEVTASEHCYGFSDTKIDR